MARRQSGGHQAAGCVVDPAKMRRRKRLTSGRACGACQPEATKATRVQPFERQALLSALRSLCEEEVDPLTLHVVRVVSEQSGLDWSQDRLRQVVLETPGVDLAMRAEGNNRTWVCWHKLPKPAVLPVPEDYPASVWSQLRRYVDELLPEDLADETRWAHSRYGLARVLSEQLPCLREYKHGQLCHVLELAVSKHRILGYRDGKLVAYRHSKDLEKKLRAEGLQPADCQCDRTFVQSWEELQGFLAVLLAEASQGVPLSSLKERFRRRFATELSETALGYTKLSDLIEDARLARVCTVFRTSVGTERFLRASRPRPPAIRWQPYVWRPFVHNTFLEFGVAERRLGATRRVRSEPPCHSTGLQWEMLTAACSLTEPSPSIASS